MNLAFFQWTATLLWSCDTGTDLMVTYQRPLWLSPSYLAGPLLAFYNSQPTLAEASLVVHRDHI